MLISIEMFDIARGKRVLKVQINKSKVTYITNTYIVKRKDEESELGKIPSS
jgi:hypothetical protein